MGIISFIRKVFRPSWTDLLKSEKPDWDRLIQAAHVWQTCATSELDVKKDWVTSAPLDPQLKAMGLDFAQIMYMRNAPFALSIIEKMNKRVEEIKQERKARLQKTLG